MELSRLVKLRVLTKPETSTNRVDADVKNSRFQPERPMSSSSSDPTTERGGDKIKRLDEDKVKFDVGDCEPLSKASMKCLEDLGYDRALARTECKPQHDAYRACRQQELDARKAANAEWAKRVGLRW